MPAPVILTPAAIPAAMKLGAFCAVAAAALMAARRRSEAPPDPAREAALDALPEGGELAARLGPGEARADAAGRWRRTLRLGRRRLEIELAGLGRARVRTVGGTRE